LEEEPVRTALKDALAEKEPIPKLAPPDTSAYKDF